MFVDFCVSLTAVGNMRQGAGRMLLNFTVENCLSFKNEQEFTMLRKKRSDSRDAQELRNRVSPVAAIYGDNAAGKSNLLKCMNFFSNFVRNSFSPRDGISTQPFLLDAEAAGRPSTFYMEFIAEDGNRYQYWFRIDARRVLEEVLWMFRAETNRRTVIFEREAGKKTRIGSQFHNVGKIAHLVRENALLLSAAAALNIESALPAYNVIANGVRYYPAVDFDKFFPVFVHRVRDDPRRARLLSDLIRVADLGIANVDFEETDAPEELVEELRKLEESGISKSLVPTVDSSLDDTGASLSRQYVVPQVLFSHQGKGVIRQLSEQWESQGTKNVMLLLDWVLDSLERPSITLLDEPDVSISTSLFSEIIRLYRNPVTNPNNSQLIFTTHNETLINASGADDRVLDRDQIWIVKKDSNTGESTLNWLMDWSPSDRENYGKNYRHGVYGGLAQPNLYETMKRHFVHMGDDGEEGQSRSRVSPIGCKTSE